MDSMNKIKIEIASSEYVIASEERPDYVLELASVVDAQIKEIMAASPSLSLTTSLVLCCLNYLDERNKARDASDNLRIQMKDYIEDATKARLEVDEMRRELDKLERDLSLGK